MYIRDLKLERFRGAHDLFLELHEKLNVFVGVNGTGKSTVLDAAAILLSWLVNRIKSAGASGRPITENDIENGQFTSNLSISLEASDAEARCSWNIAKAKRGYNKKDVVSALKLLSETAKRMQERLSDSMGLENIPLFAYYPVNRVVLDIPLRIRQRHRSDLLSAYDDALVSGANFRTFFEWFREREDLENENQLDAKPNLKAQGVSFPDPQLEAVRKVLTQFMPEFSNLRVRRSPLRMEIEKQGKRLTVNQLSHGEKCLMAMIGDMARRMAIANPLRENPLEGEGVFLIDEIDLHLHPRWQHMIVSRLGTVFPNCQFLISTHSPHVVTHVLPESLFLLDMAEEGLRFYRSSHSYGKTAERVLEDLMGLETTRPDKITIALEEIYSLIDKGDYAEARRSIDALRERIGGDSELVKAAVLIKRKELIGK